MWRWLLCHALADDRAPPWRRCHSPTTNFLPSTSAHFPGTLTLHCDSFLDIRWKKIQLKIFPSFTAFKKMTFEPKFLGNARRWKLDGRDRLAWNHSIFKKILHYFHTAWILPGASTLLVCLSWKHALSSRITSWGSFLKASLVRWCSFDTIEYPMVRFLENQDYRINCHTCRPT